MKFPAFATRVVAIALGCALWSQLGIEAAAWAQAGSAGAVYRQVQSYRPGDGPATRAWISGSLYVVQVGDRALRGVESATDAVRWEVVPAKGRITRTARTGDLVAVEASDLFGVDLQTGQIRWTYPLDCPTAIQCKEKVIALTSNSAVIAGSNGKWRQLNVVDLATGALRWGQWAETGPVAHATQVGNTIVVAGGQAPYPISGYDAASGRTLWSLGAGLGDKPIEGLVAFENYVHLWSHAPASPEVVAIDATVGLVRGRVALGKSRIDNGVSAAVAPGWAIVSGAYLVSLDRKAEGDEIAARKLPEGRLLWSRPAQPSSRPAAAGRLLVIHTRTPKGDAVQAIDLETGETRFSMQRKGAVRGVVATEVGSRVHVGIQGVSPIAVGIDPQLGQLVSVALPKAPDNVSIDAISGDERELAFVAGGTLYRLEAASVQSVGDELRTLLGTGGESRAREIFADIHDLVGALPSAASLTKLLTNHDMLVIESSIAAGDFAGAASRMTAVTAEDRLRYPADVAAFVEAASDLLTRRLHEVGAALDARVDSSAAMVNALRGAATRAFELGQAWEADLGAAGVVESGLMRLAFFMHLRNQSEAGLQILGQLATAPWSRRKEPVDTYRGAALIASARAMLRNAAGEFKARNNVEAWAILRDAMGLPGMATVYADAASQLALLGALDPDSSAGKRDLRKIHKTIEKALSGPTTPERGWTPAACTVDCQLAAATCQVRPCANWRHCDDDQRACLESCNNASRRSPVWPKTQPATLGTPEWWNCR